MLFRIISCGVQLLVNMLQKQDDAQPLGHSPLHNSRHLNLNHGGGSHQAFKRGEIVWAWILTIPVTAFLAYWLQRLVMGIDIP